MTSRGARRGSALLQVLVMSLILSLLCALILRSRLTPALAAAKAVDRVRQDLDDQGALNLVGAAWLKGGTCASAMESGVACSGSGCACVCVVPGGRTVVAAPVGGGAGACALSAGPPSSMPAP
ncbi:MAG: hypothetical protein HY552_05675 [Elusimicrobia bacterium]|nr:hypothetical protein [Elusimicrobiota bacterium]